MRNYALKKIIIMLVTVFAVSLITFFAFSAISGNPATSMLGMHATPERVKALEAEYGLDKPLPVQYWKWVSHFVRGDFGISYSYHIPVAKVLSGKVGVTLILTLMAFLLIVLFSVPLGVTSAMHVGGKRDRILQVVGQLMMSVPPFFMGMLLTILFGLVLHFFVPGGFTPYSEDPWAFIRCLFFPALAIAIPRSAMVARFLRNSLISEINKEYVRTAYSRGNDSKSVFYRHMLRNAMIPVITFLAVAIPEIVAGSIVVEQVFGIAGIGRILLTSISNRDYPVVLTIVVFMTVLVMLMNLLADLMYHKLDVRIGNS